MNLLKKLFSLCLALAVILSLAVPALAAGEGTPTTFTITINPSQSNEDPKSHEEHTYEAYQILSGEIDKDEANQAVLKDPKWGAKFPYQQFINALKAELSYGEGEYSIFSNLNKAKPDEAAAEFARVISDVSFSASHEEKLAEIVFKVIADFNKTAEEANKCTPIGSCGLKEGTTNVYQITGIPAGFYMIKDQDGSLEGKENKDYTDIILHVSDNVEIHHKGAIPTLTKAVSELGSEYTDKIAVATDTEYYYRLVATLPDDFTNYDTYKCVFHDTLGAGIDFEGVVEAYIPRGVNEKEILHKHHDTDHPFGYKVVESGQNVTITFENLKHHSNTHNITNGSKIFVIYKAKLNKDAVIARTGNNNTAYLEYSNNPSDPTITGKTSSHTTQVYTYGVRINKYDGATPSTKLQNVKFVLYRENSVTSNDDTKATHIYQEYAEVNSNGVITNWIREADWEKNEIPEEVEPLITDDKGQITLYGLDSREDYFLVETESVGVYNRILEPVKIYLTATVNEQKTVNSITATVTGSDCHVPTNDPNFYDGRVVDSNGTVTTEGVLLGVNLNIPNYKGAVLPSTGGIGTTIFYIIGSVLVLGAVVMLVTKKRMS